MLADENTSHHLIDACQRLVAAFPIVHIADWEDGSWLSQDDATLLMACADAGLVLITFDRATLAWHVGQVIRAGEDAGGVIVFRRGTRSTDYGTQARMLTDLWERDGNAWDWLNRIVYLPRSLYP